jgi:heme/copper-type cytochrome/quinol oxidase subunit 1
MLQSPLASVLFLAAGIVFAVASLFASRVASPSIDVLVHATYLVIGHVHMLAIAALICVSYAGLYYACARFLHLTIPIGLSLAHFAITLLALIGLGNLHYLGLGHGGPTAYNPLIGVLAVNALALLLVSGILFFGIIILASMLKVRHRRAGI